MIKAIFNNFILFVLLLITTQCVSNKDCTDFSNIFTSTNNSLSYNDAFLTDVQKYTFKYFYDYAHPVSGFSRDKLDSTTYVGDDLCVTGGTGMGLMAIIVGVQRGFITRTDGVTRVLTILNFFKNNCKKYHGAFGHWINGANGNPFSDDDDIADIVETAYVAQGLICVYQYFNNQGSDEIQIRSIAKNLWEAIDWDWYRNNQNYLSWAWSESKGFVGDVTGFNECMIVYLLGIASPTHNISVSCYNKGWARGWGGQNYTTDISYGGIKQYIQQPTWGMNLSLFWTHYSYLGFDPRGKNDGIIPAGLTYYDVLRNITLINQKYCEKNPGGYSGYSNLVWGLTASFDPFGYLAHSPDSKYDNGTISPTAALSAIVYTPLESITTMKYLYKNYPQLWGDCGFKDSFNLQHNKYCEYYVAIDQGPIIIMIENYRTQLLWKLFMTHPDIIHNLIPKLKSSGWKINDILYN